MMKRSILAAALLGLSLGASAEAPGGPSCGWGNMLFEGNSGMAFHFLASTTNGTTGNATFGMTSGTNGCSTDGRLTYSGKSLLAQASVMEEFTQDVARGQGDAMNAVAISMGVPAEARPVFAQVMHQHFDQLFPSADATADQVYGNMLEVMKSDARLQPYTS
jgi:hypothetical protein